MAELKFNSIASISPYWYTHDTMDDYAILSLMLPQTNKFKPQITLITFTANNGLATIGLQNGT